MKYTVVHTEKYVNGSVTKEFDNINKFLEEYPIDGVSFLEKNELPKEKGESVGVIYDHYITLKITAS